MPDRDDLFPVLAGGGSVLAGGSLLRQAMQDPNFKQMSTASMHNYLPGFYKKGITAAGQYARVGKEGVMGGTNAITQGMNPRQSYAYASSGISNRLEGKIAENHKNIEAVKQKYLTDPNYTFKQAQRDIAFQVKESHFKATNDFSNARLYKGARGQSRVLQDYVGRKGSRKGTIAFVENSSAKQVLSEGIAKEELAYMKDLQKISPSERVAFQKYGRQSIQNPLRGIQFDRRVYNVMQQLAILRSEGQLTQSSLLSSLDSAGLLGDPKKPMFRQLTKTKIAFNLSPVMKSNFDWGGYNGVVTWDSKKPDVVKLLASDKRDLFRVPMNRTSLNYVEPQTLRISKFEPDVQKLVAGIEESIEKGIADKPKKIKGTKKRATLFERRLAYFKRKAQGLKGKLFSAGQLSQADMAFLWERWGGEEGVQKLGKSYNSIIEAQEKLLEEKNKAFTRAETGSKHYKKYLNKRWLPSRLKLGGGVGLLGWGALQLASTLMDD